MDNAVKAIVQRPSALIVAMAVRQKYAGAVNSYNPGPRIALLALRGGIPEELNRGAEMPYWEKENY
ncbi:MAG: hypothetical protein IT266_03225 [Saprospiraceae bacterium]|nr:hypothetical protein [Saprospiraceae bacterium]